MRSGHHQKAVFSLPPGKSQVVRLVTCKEFYPDVPLALKAVSKSRLFEDGDNKLKSVEHLINEKEFRSSISHKFIIRSLGTFQLANRLISLPAT